MAFRQFLGLYRADYSGDASVDDTYRVLTESDLRRLGPRYQDIACLDTDVYASKGRVCIQCSPGDEYFGIDSNLTQASSSYRKWGQYQYACALVLPFKIDSSHSNDCMIREFHVELTLKNLTESSAQSSTRPGEEESIPSVTLLDAPHPRKLERTYAQDGWLSAGKWWKFESRPVPDPSSGKFRSARMSWSGVRHEPDRLHCALAIEHANEDFGLTCRVRGRASIGRYTYAFDNQTDGRERIWRLVPRQTGHDLETCIGKLADDVRLLNNSILNDTETQVKELLPSQPHPQQPAAPHWGHFYTGPITIHGPAHLGDSSNAPGVGVASNLSPSSVLAGMG